MTAGPSRDAEGADADALRASLQRPGLPADAQQRIRQAVAAEWQQLYGVTPPRNRTLHRAGWAAAMGFGLLSVAALIYLRSQPPPVAATVANGLSGSLSARSANQGVRRLSAGAPLRQGDDVTASGPAELRWLRGGLLRLRPGAQLAVVNDTDIRLTAGAIFVDIAPGYTSPVLRILTPYGTVEHVGTQFVVSLEDAHLAVGVRQGKVSVIAAATTSLAAGDQLQLRDDGVAHLGRLRVDDPVWRWTGEPLFAFDPEGRTVLELLQWVSQEKGRPLEFASDGLKQQAADVILHGSIRGLTVDEALALMLATTSLQAGITADRVDVSATAAAPATHRR